jgi:hypothetical protein
MFSDSISLLTLLVIHFGFAGLLGAMAGRIRTVLESGVLAFLALVYLVATFTLPLPTWANVLVLMASLFLAALSASRFPRQLFQPRVGWLYAGFAMLLVLLWSTVQGWQYPVLTLGAAAGLAATLAWRRGLYLRY